VAAADRGALARYPPSVYGPWSTCHERFVRWRRDGIWDRLLAYVQTNNDAVGELEWVVSVDATINRAHQHAAGARGRAAQADRKRGSPTRHRRRSAGPEAG
jgi:transposase